MASPKIMSLKLLVDKSGPRVLFAEVPEEFVDFLSRIFSLPLGTLIDTLGSKQMVGCLGKLKDSIELSFKMDNNFNPQKTAFNGDIFQLCIDQESKPAYRCAHAAGNNVGYGYDSVNRYACMTYTTLYVNSICPSCNRLMNVPMNVVMPQKEGTETNEENKKKKGRYEEKEVPSYMVMDNLVVERMMSTTSTISSITFINRFGIKDLSQLEEKTVSFGKEEGLKLLMASFKTDKVLTAIFMGKKGAIDSKMA